MKRTVNSVAQSTTPAYFVPIDKCVLWDKNPRGITTADFARLKKQISRLGPYKPLIVTPAANGTFIVLGGNMRLRALRELKHTDVWVSIVHAPTDAIKTEYALSDNDRAGYYDEIQLAEYTLPVIDDIDPEMYKVDLGTARDLADVLAGIGPPANMAEPESGASDFGEFIEFHFGDYRGRVQRAIYDAFAKRVNAIRSKTEAVLIDDILAVLLNVKPK